MSDAYERCSKAASDQDYDNLLWTATERALGAALRGAKDLVIVVDGVDESSCGELALFQKLAGATSKATNVKLIAFGAQTPPSTPGQSNISVTDDLIFDDIAAVVRSALGLSHVFTSLPEMDQETLVDRITQASQGSFLSAKLLTKRVRSEDNVDGLRKAVDTAINAKLTTTDHIHQTLHAADVTDDAKLMLLWLATADRPLLVKELEALASIQVDKQTVTDRRVEPLHTLRPLTSLVFLQDGQIFLRHALIRAAIIDLFSSGKLIPAVKDRHADLATRLLVYIKSTVTHEQEPSLTALDWHEANPLLSKHPLLDFAVRYWPTHFRHTAVFVKEGEVPAAKTFAKVLPTSTTPFLLGTTLWENRPTPELVTYHTMVTNMCRQVLSTNHVVTLQSIISLAILYRRIGFAEAIPLFHEATTVSRKLLTPRHIVTMKMATFFLDLTVEMVSKTKTDVMVKREEILLVLVECYKSLYGNTSEQVVSTMKLLIEHYQLVEEEKKVQEIMVSLRSITTSEYGVESDDSHGNFQVRLRARDQKSTETGVGLLLDIEEEDQLIERSESFDFDAKLTQAQKYLSESRVDLAERTYVEIWQRVTKESRFNTSALWEERKMKAVVAYATFLKSQKREYEASTILSTAWQEHEQTSRSMTETSASYFQEIGKMMKTVGLTTAALAIFKQCAHYYHSTNRTQTSSYKEIQQSIQSTSKDVMQSASSSTTVVSESTLEEMVSEASTSVATFDQSSFAATQSLITMYISQHRWQDATRLIKKVLHGIWPSLFAPSLQDVTLPEKNVENSVDLAERLSQCYHSRRRVGKEEDIRVRIYRAVRSGRKVEDKLRERVTTELLRLFERTSQADRNISLRQEMLNDYINHYGPEHSIVIKTLWTLAELTRPRPVSVDYYLQIIRTLNKDSPTCHPEAFEALVIVTTELWNQGRYSDALQHYRTIFTTFLSEPKQSPKFQDQVFVREIFNRYTHCLRSVRTDFSVIHKVTVDYQSKCKTVFGATASISVQATLSLARLCQESKRYEHEAVTLYEELLKTKSEEIDHREISATLDAIYEEQAAVVTSSRSESVSSTQVDRAVKMLKQRVTSVRQTHGWAHEESLSKMREMVSFHSKRNETQTVVQELKEATEHILSSESSSTRLTAAAATIAASYMAAGQTQKVTELSQEVYRQVMMKDTSNSKSVKFDLASKERQSLAFLAQLEYSQRRDSSTTITEILAALTTEYVYFEEFRHQTKAKSTTLHAVSVSAARLYQFLISRERQTAANRVFDEYTNYFLATEGKRVKLTEPSQVKIFLLTILDHFSTHQSDDFVRSIGITSNVHVIQLLRNKQYQTACDLALASFLYISAHNTYRTPGIVKFIFTLGLTISGRDMTPQPDEAARKKMLSVSATIIQDALRVIKDLKVNLAQLSLVHLNRLIGLLGEQQDYKTLAWLLTILWNSRKSQNAWQSDVTLALGRRFILARYLVGDAMAALRLAEDIVYNCRRVHGARHPSTLEMSVLLTQLYTGIAQRYQSHKDGQDMASRYYKKSAATHENILRIFSDPSYAELEGGLDASMSLDGSTYDLDMAANGQSTLSDGEHVRQHLQLLKLSVERLGHWPKDYSEYERLNADVFREFADDMKGVQGVEKWNLKSFGGGKAESNEDMLNLDVKNWELVDAQPENGVEEEL